MLRNSRAVALLVVVLIAAVFAADGLVSRARLANVVIEGRMDPPTLVADGRNTGVLTLHITEGGRARVGDLIQCFLQEGNGLLIPQWSYSDANGETRINLTPNALTEYDIATGTLIHCVDTSIGRIVEAGKEFTIPVEVEAPSE
jgi:hypothetical protein